MKINTRQLVIMGVMIAMEIVLSRFLSINAWNVKIGFSFVPVVITAMLYGAVPAGIVGAAADFLGAVLFPIGAYFPGFTLTAFLTGMVFGFFLFKQRTLPRIAGAVLINQMIFGLFLNTFWISVLYGSDFRALFAVRAVQALILTVVQIAGILLIRQAMEGFLVRKAYVL
ncbi:MAG: folate family ECF transporter S component [Eubacterium sp.]|nr:folate family ECF transporter S component [Eubacterium sp.]